MVTDSVYKLCELNGIPVYTDPYLLAEDVVFSIGPLHPDAYCTGPAVCLGGIMMKPDGTPIENNIQENTVKFILTGIDCKREFEKNELKIKSVIKDRYDIDLF